MNNKYIISLTEEEESELDKNFKELGIESETRKALIEKFKIEGRIDSTNQDMINRVPKEYFELTPNEPIKRYVFPDGSVLENKMEEISSRTIVPEEKSNAMSTKEMSTEAIVISGTGYSIFLEYLVTGNDGIVKASFYVDFTLNLGKNAFDQIVKVYDEVVTTYGGTYSDVDLSIVRPREDLYQDAYARLKFQYRAIQDVYATTGYLKFYVGKDHYRTDAGL